MQQSTLKILKDLIKFPSLTPDAAGSLDYIQEFITNIGGKFKRIDSNGTTNLIAEIGTGTKIFAFAGHVDVVPTGDANQWPNATPFELQEQNGRLIGRGTVDMKGAIAAFMAAMHDFVLAKPDISKYKIMLLITSDEEGDADDGTIKMVEKLQQEQIRLDYCLVGEPTSASQLGDTIKVGRRGSLTGELTVIGLQGHVAYPDLCINPIHKALPALTELVQVKLDDGNEYFPPTSLQFANLNAGVGARNVIPGQLTANFNFRYNPIQTAESLKSTVVQVLDKYNLNYQITWRHSANPFLTTIGEMVAVAKNAVSEICGIDAQLKTDGGTSDARFLIAISNELIELGLLNATAHKINEYTTLSDLGQLTAIYNRILCKIFND